MNILRTMIDAVKRHYRREMTYRELMGLDDRQLADIGISRSMIAHVALLGNDGLAQVRSAQCEIESLSNINKPWAA